MDRVSPTEQPVSAPASTTGAGGVHKNPYVGPRSLKYGEAIYGRDREARQLLELLIAERIVLLYSPSGAGKTSLIQAGLIPELEKEEFNVLPVMRVSRGVGDGLYPCNPYVMSALLSLEQRVPPEQAIPAEELASMPLCEYLKRREAASGTNDGTFLIFDQFEEILTIDPMNREAKMDFFNQVGEALRDLKRWALFAMREDHVAALDPYLRPVPTRLKSTFRLDLLSAESARIAVQRPAKEGGVEFTEEAVTKLVDDLRQVAVQGPTGATVQQLGPYIEPVQLQVVCYRLWEKLPENVERITEEYVVGTGDVDSALADYYAERVAQIAGKSGVKERVLREWFDRRLITESGIRSQVMVGAENSKEISEAAVQALVDVHLIRGEERRGVTWLELAHDRLVKPIRADNAKWWERNLSVLQHQAAVWNNQGRSDALCLRGAARQEAQKWAEEHAGELTEPEREFLEVCQRNHDARKNKWALAAVSVLTVVLSCFAVLTGIAVWQWRTATTERNIANARGIAAQAYRLRDERLDTALLLATEGQRLVDLPETRGSLLSAAYHNPRLTTYLRGSASTISALAFSADGKLLATGDFEGQVAFWDVNEHCLAAQQIPAMVKDAVRRIAFSADGHYLAVSSKDKTVALRDLRTGEVRQLPPDMAHKSDVWSLEFSDDSTLLISGDGEGRIVFWDMTTGAATSLPSLENAVRGLSLGPGATMLAAGCNDGSIRLWTRQADDWLPQPREFSPLHPNDREMEQRTREANIVVDAKRKNVRCLALSPDGKYVVAGRRSGAVDLYDLSSPEAMVPVAAFGRHDGPVSALAFSADSTRLVTSGFDGTLRLWKVPSMEPVGPPFTGHVGRVLGVAFSGDKQTVASGGSDRHAILWDTWLHVPQTSRSETTDARFGVAFSPDAAWEANAYENGTVMILRRDLAKWPEYSAKELPQPPPLGKGVPILTFSVDSRYLATTTPEGKLRVHELGKASAGASPRLITEIDVTGGDSKRKITSVSLSRDAGMVAAGVSVEDAHAQVLAWRVATRDPIFDGPLETERDTLVYAVEFNPDGKSLVTAGDAERTVIWNLADKARKHPIICMEVHTGSIRSVVFSPDGKIFATTSGDNTLALWDGVTGARLAPQITGHLAPVVSAAFSPDGKLLASGSDDHSVILWDVASKQPTGRLTGHTDSVRAVAFSPDGKRLFSGSWGEETRAWELDPAVLQKICRERANRNLSSGEWEAYLHDGKYRVTWPGLPVPMDDVKSSQ